MKSLEIYTDQEIQALQKTVVKRFEMIKEIIGAHEQGKKAQGQDLTLPVAVRDDLLRVLASYHVIYSDKASSSKCPKGSKESRWIPIGMNDLKKIKQAVKIYGFHSAFVREMIKTWPFSIKVMPHDQLQLVSSVLDDGPKLMFKCYFREDAKILEQHGKTKGLETSQDQILGEGTFADPWTQEHYDEQTCHYAAKQYLMLGKGFKN